MRRCQSIIINTVKKNKKKTNAPVSQQGEKPLYSEKECATMKGIIDFRHKYPCFVGPVCGGKQMKREEDCCGNSVKGVIYIKSDKIECCWNDKKKDPKIIRPKENCDTAYRYISFQSPDHVNGTLACSCNNPQICIFNDKEEFDRDIFGNKLSKKSIEAKIDCTRKHEEYHKSVKGGFCKNADDGVPVLKSDKKRNSEESIAYGISADCFKEKAEKCKNDPLCSNAIYHELNDMYRLDTIRSNNYGKK